MTKMQTKAKKHHLLLYHGFTKATTTPPY